MKKSRILTIIAAVLVLMLCFTACGKKHECESICDTCGKCTDAACTEDACADKCAGHKSAGEQPGGNEETKTTPVISVTPAEVEIHAGEEIDLMFGVSVTDEGDDAVEVIISDDNDFDAEIVGVYTITYSATNKHGNSATATRKVTVLEALPVYTLEVQKDYTGEAKWNGTTISFKNHLYVELSEDTDAKTYPHGSSGIYHNGTDATRTLNIGGDYGVIAIIDANGVVREGISGATAKAIDADHPIRETTTKTVDASAFGENVQVPAGYYAIVVCTGYAGTGYDFDGRGFIDYNVIRAYGTVVRLTVADQEAPLTTYVDQAPVISGNGNAAYATDSSFVLNDAVLEGVKAIDDNGTFDPSDDEEVEVTVTANGGFDILVPGTYSVTLSAADANGNTATATREVKVTTEVYDITIGNKNYKTDKSLVAVDEELTAIGKYLLLVYTPEYKKAHEELGFSANSCAAIVLNSAGQVVKIYDGANGGFAYYDIDNPAGLANSGKYNASTCLSVAYSELQDGEYLIVGLYNGNNAGRAFVLSCRPVGGGEGIGAQAILPDVTFGAHVCLNVCDLCGKCQNADCEEAACVDNKCVCTVCPVADCGLCINNECTCENKCQGHAHICANVCKYCNLCTNADCGEEECASKCAGHSSQVIVDFGEKFFIADADKCSYNTQVNNNTTPKAQDFKMIIYDKNYAGTFTTNSYGVALVFSADGTLVKGYAWDGYYTAEGKASIHYAVGDYATTAFAELAEGEILIIFPNDGVNATDSARTFGKSICDGYATYMGQKATLQY